MTPKSNSNSKKENTQKCKKCNNVFRIELIKEGPDYNDFGFRFCPFCGTIIDELAH